jgi:hypothetical protein
MSARLWRERWGAGLFVSTRWIWLEVRFNDVMGNVARWGIGGVEIGAWW